MKIKEVSAGIKVTKNYDSYQASLSAELETGENPEKVGAELMEKATVIVTRQMGARLHNGSRQVTKKTRQMNEKGVEVGAAWPDKKFSDRLSVKYSNSNKWEDVKIAHLEKTSEGYKQKNIGGVFIFKKIPDEKRTNDKMPVYRIYKV